jgi:chromosome segregation ATPase
MALNNSQVLGVLKRMRDDQEALLHARGVIEAFMQAQETLINLDTLKAVKEKEIAELEGKKQSEIDKREKDRFEHKREMDGLAKERDTLRAEVAELKREAAQERGSVEESIAYKQSALASWDHQIAQKQEVLQAVKHEIETLKKKFAA